jgi:putative hydrolase of the HAD superfamily
MARGANDFSLLKSPPDAVLFDLDDTLYPYDVCHAAGFDAAVAHLSNLYAWDPATTRRAYLDGRSEVHERLHGQAASHSRLLYVQGLLGAKGKSSDLKAALDFETEYWSEYFGSMKLFPGVTATLVRLREAGIQTGIVTDLTARVQFEKLVALGLSDLVDCVVTSEEAGVEKPDSALFRLALAKLEIRDPTACWMVGDSVDRDIAGAQRLGMCTLHKVLPGGTGSEQATCTFDSFERLLSFLQTL